ncbi:MAG TPA: L,D-transpeptidase family protein, partial [Phenylobacterium sp.]
QGDVFDAALEQALMDFQRHHELQADGVVGRGTLAALNVTAEDRLAQLDANLERWRWLPALPAERIEVDVAAANAILYDDDAPRLAMRVVVGDAQHKTPMFSSRLDALVFNPPWNVPSSIAAKELLPHERADPGYLARNDFVVVGGALQQRPGPRNALGRVKFDFPSPFGVYLHDTPSRAAFARPGRWLSHGCIRLEKPRELAAAVLGPQGWGPDRIDAVIEAGETTRVQLSNTVPLYVLYWTVVLAEDGRPAFRPDPYAWDAKLMKAIAGAGRSRGKVAQIESGCPAAKAPRLTL